MPLLQHLSKRAFLYEKKNQAKKEMKPLAKKGGNWVNGNCRRLKSSAAYPVGLGAAWSAMLALGEYGVPRSKAVLNRTLDEIYKVMVLPVIEAAAAEEVVIYCSSSFFERCVVFSVPVQYLFPNS